MKRLFLFTAILTSLFFTACSTDDESSDDNSQDCFLCTIEIEFGGDVQITESEICDNEDGTVTITSEGQTEVIDLEGNSFDDFIETFQFLGNCESL